MALKALGDVACKSSQYGAEGMMISVICRFISLHECLEESWCWIFNSRDQV